MFGLSDWQRHTAARHFIDRAPIGGRQRPTASGATFDAIGPTSNRLLARVTTCDMVDVDAAVAAARRAFDEGPWVRPAPTERKRALLRLVELMLAHREELALLDSLNMGKPTIDAWNVDVPDATHVFAWYAENLDKLYDQVTPTAQQVPAIITRVPLGATGAVVPWNFPLSMAAWKLAPALAVGNPVVLKPAERSPFLALRLAELALEAGVPGGVLNVVPGLGEQTGKALGLHPGMDTPVFTGSIEVGKYFMQYSTQFNLKQIWLKCGGKDPSLAFTDCRDLDLVTEEAAFGIFFNQGEVCSANSRLLVEHSIRDESVGRLLTKARDWQPGDPLNPASRAGAVVDHRQTAGVLITIKRAQSEDATLLNGGRQSTTNGSDNFIEPTLFGNVHPDMQLARGGIFGPVLAVSAFDSEDETIRLANGSRCGLTASLRDDGLHHTHQVARRLNAGTVSAGTVGALNVAVPFGGGKQSGFGRNLPLHSFDKYTQLKTTWLQLR